MEVRLRHVEAEESIPFTNIHFSEVPQFIEFVNSSGGVHISEDGDTYPYSGYQIIIDGSSAYLDVYVGKE